MTQHISAQDAGRKSWLDQANVLVVGSVVRDMTYAIDEIPAGFETLWARGKVSVPRQFAPNESRPGAFILPEQHMPEGEEALAGTCFSLLGERSVGIGGAAYNAAVRCLSQLGAEAVRIRCCVGEDPDGNAIWDDLMSIRGLDLSGTSRRRGTAKSWILRSRDGERFIFTCRSQPPEVPDSLFGGAPGLMILCNCGDPATSIRFLERAAGEPNASVAWIAARNDLQYISEQGEFPFDFATREASCLCLTKDEFEAASDAMRGKLLRAFAVVALTDGGKGGEIWRLNDKGEPRRFRYPAARTPGKPVDTTGAGDAFATTLAISLFGGAVPQEAAERARLVAAQVVCAPGATGDLTIRRAEPKTSKKTG